MERFEPRCAGAKTFRRIASGSVRESFEFQGTSSAFYLLSCAGCFGTLCSFGLYYPWWAAEHHNCFWSNTWFQGRRLRANVTGVQMLKVKFFGLLIAGLSFGLARPLAGMLQRRVEIDSIYLNGPLVVASLFGREDEGASAFEHGIADASDTLGAVWDFF